MLLVLPGGNTAPGMPPVLLERSSHQLTDSASLSKVEMLPTSCPHLCWVMMCVEPQRPGSVQVDLASLNGSFVGNLLSDTTAE